MEEYKFRLDIFSKADEKIQATNANPDNTYEAGHNMFSTMTEEES